MKHAVRARGSPAKREDVKDSRGRFSVMKCLLNWGHLAFAGDLMIVSLHTGTFDGDEDHVGSNGQLHRVGSK